MQRRDFIRNTALGALAVPQLAISPSPPTKDGRLLNCFYLQAHTSMMVPSHVRYDLDRMADMGVNALTLGILEQDLQKAVGNIGFIRNEAAKRNMKVLMIPSRWAGIFAGGTSTASLFLVQYPDMWRRKSDGSISISDSSGILASIHHTGVADFILEKVSEAIKTWNLDGVLWDEPRIWDEDYSEVAKKILGINADDKNAQYQAGKLFMSRLCTSIHARHPQVLNLFYSMADTPPDLLEVQMKIGPLDYFGCSGLPWPSTAKDNDKIKRYLPDVAPAFSTKVKALGMKDMLVIKNPYITHEEDYSLLEEYLPKLAALKPDFLGFYYFPRNAENPERQMAIFEKALKDFY